MCLLLVALLPYVCSALCFCWATLFAIAPGSCLVWCLYSHIASSSHVVRIIIIYVLLFEFSFCTFTCSSCFSACEHIFFVSYLLFVTLPYFCSVLCFSETCIVCRCFLPYQYDVCLFMLQTTTSFVSSLFQ